MHRGHCSVAGFWHFAHAKSVIWPFNAILIYVEKEIEKSNVMHTKSEKIRK